MTTLIPQYDQGSTNAVNRPINQKLGEWLSVKDFGAIGDGTTNDTTAIQNALIYAFANNKSLFFPTATYVINATLIIPQYNNLTYQGISVDGNFSTIKMSSDVTTFTSGYYNSGTLTTNYGTTLDSHYSQGIRLINFNISSASALTSAALKIQDWHQGCLLKNITCENSTQMLLSNNNYYTTFDTLISSGGTGANPTFTWTGNVNLHTITGCVAINPGGIGYLFSGGVTGTEFTNNSVEGMATGIQFTGQVYDIAISNNYFEGVTGTFIKFTSYVNAALISNNYINFKSIGTNYFLDYVAGPINNIILDQSNTFVNMTTVSQMIKTLDSTSGYNQLTLNFAPGYTNGTLVDNTKFSSQINWKEVYIQSGYKANVVNNYAVGNYSGKYSAGFSGAAGFTNTSTGTSIYLTTNILPSDTQLIYVNLKIVTSFNTTYVKGQFVGTDFYIYNGSSLAFSTTLSISVPGSTVQINGTGSGTVSTITGEIRLL